MKKILFLSQIFFFLFTFSSVIASDSTNLQSAIEEKNKNLAAINTQIQQIQSNLEVTQKTKQTLKNEITNFNLETKQVKLGISASQTKIDELNLRIGNSKNRIQDVEWQIAQKKITIGENIKLLYQNDQENFLAFVLKNNNTLSDKFLTIESLNNLNEKINKDVIDLQSLENELHGRIDTMAQQKKDKQGENDNLKNRNIILTEINKEKKTLLAQAQNQENNYQNQLNQLEKQRLEIAEEMEKIEEQLRLKINPNALPIKGPGVLAYPVSNPIVTQGYGATNFASVNYRGKWHNGIDLGAPIGTPVYSAEKGRVIMIGNQDRYCPRAAYGKFIVIQHENNLTTLYGHLSLQIVDVGNKVERGQLIGYVGKTGWATGPHVHFTIWSNQTFGIKQTRFCGPMPVGGDLNPLDYL